MRILLLIILPFTLTTFGQKSTKKLKGIYGCRWADTWWVYHFKKNNKFNFRTSGHWGYSTTAGKYIISNDTVYIKAYPKEMQKDKHFVNLNDSLLFVGDSCISSLSLRQDYFCKRRKDGTFPFQVDR